MKFPYQGLHLERPEVDPRSCKVLLTKPPMNPKINRQHMIQLIFEGPGRFVINTPAS